jgi:hypothetical protein
VGTSASAWRASFWRADWLVGDFASTRTSRKPSDRIAIIAIDDQSATPPAAAAPVDGGRTVAFRAQAADGGAPVMAAGNALVSVPRSPGYDAFQKDEQTPGARLDVTSVLNKSGAPERPPGRRREHRPGALTREL